MTYFYESLPILTPYSIFSNRNAYEVETISLKRTVFLTEAQRWELSFSVLTTGDEAALLAAHTWNYYGKKTMIMPQLPNVLKSFSFNGTLTASANTAAGQDSVVCSADADGTIPAGTFVKLEGHNKVYATTSSVTFDTAEEFELNLFPNLHDVVMSGEEVLTGDDCVISYRLDFSSISGINITDGFITNPGTIKLVEAL